MNESEFRTTMGPTFPVKAGQPTPEGMRVWAIMAIKGGSKIESLNQFRLPLRLDEGEKVEVTGDPQKILGITSFPLNVPFIFEGWAEDITVDEDDTTSEFWAYYLTRTK